MGGSIPFMEVFGKLFPESNFILTGAVLPDSNIHAPNETLNLELCRRMTTTIAEFLALL